MSEVDLEKFAKVLNETIDREKNAAGWMADVIRLLPSQEAYRHLPSFLQEEIEGILAAIE